LHLHLLFINVLHCTASPEDGAIVKDKPFYSSLSSVNRLDLNLTFTITISYISLIIFRGHKQKNIYIYYMVQLQLADAFIQSDLQLLYVRGHTHFLLTL